MNPDIFFSTLGMKNISDPSSIDFWQDIWRSLEDRGINPDKILEKYHPMSPEIANLYFMDEETGLKILSADIERFRMLVENIETSDAFRISPQRIIEIGGGPGIISLWLALKFRNAECIVYDISENALALGKKLAERLGVKNIDFRRAGYADLAGMKNPEKADLVIGLSAVFLQIVPENIEGHFSADIDPFGFRSPARDIVSDFVKACASLVSAKGMIYFSQGAFNDLGLLSFFSFLRKNSLGMDWRLTQVSGEGNGAGFSFKEIHIFARPFLSSVFRNAREDLRTFLYSGRNISSEEIGHADFEAWLGLLSDGVKIAEVVTRKDDDTFEKFMIFCKSGVLGFFSSSGSGRRSGFRGNAADYIQTADRLKSAIDKYRENGVEIISEYWHPEYERIKVSR